MLPQHEKQLSEPVHILFTPSQKTKFSVTAYVATKPPDSTKWMGKNWKGKNDSLAWFESLLPHRSLSAQGIS